MIKIRAEEVRQLKARFREINQIPLEKIEWIDETGQEIILDPKDVDYWRFCGLNNVDFVEFIIDAEEIPETS